MSALSAEDLVRANSAEAPITQGLIKLGVPGLARAGYMPGAHELTNPMDGFPDPLLGLGPNGHPQSRETLSQMANRIVSAEEATRDFEKFSLMFSVGLDRSGRMQSIDIIDSGIAPIAEAAGINVRFKENDESNLIYGIYFVQQYYRAMLNCDNNPAAFIKLMENVATQVEDFRLDTPEVLEILNQYPMAKAMFDYLTDPETVYALQNSNPPTDPRLEYERILGFIRTPGAPPIPTVGGFNLDIPGRYPGEPLSREAEAQLGYATLEGLGWRDAINHRRVTQDAAGNYVWDKEETETAIFKTPVVPDPFASAARPRVFVQYVKQRLGKEVGKNLGLDTLDIGWRTYAVEVLKRAVAQNSTVFTEMTWEDQMGNRMKTKDPFNALGPNHNIAFPAGSIVNGRLPANPNIDYEATHSRYPNGTVINGVNLSGQEISVGMIRNIKKHHKAADVWAEMYKAYLNPYAKMEEVLVNAVNAIGEYAREAFGDALSAIQRQHEVPKVTSAVMRIAAQRGIPLSDEVIKRTIQGEKTDLGMHKGVKGFFSSRFEQAKMTALNESAKAKGREIAAPKGESVRDDISGLIKVFWGGK